ncbi:Trans-hexaprenyltranstransferase, component II [Lactiplantibacillus plantarum subsp. plantarum]|nr:polyprenyl synthetase [Lactiplantibacillus plantarum subsp. plantarum ATCC 14917 = JCM 1149 = CGMCC 1.2437]SPX69456.1 Trans-hexaprenyltranstransferase, component II [Lactiplantibacillus plantarum subsp. plantarum]
MLASKRPGAISQIKRGILIMMQTIWQPESLVAKELAALKPYLATNVKIDNAAINDRVHDLLAAGGKFLRPGFFYLFSQFGPDHNTARLRAGAAAMELLHVATLIHDDVIDESPERRHVTTIHQDYGQRLLSNCSWQNGPSVQPQL